MKMRKLNLRTKIAQLVFGGSAEFAAPQMLRTRPELNESAAQLKERVTLNLMRDAFTRDLFLVFPALALIAAIAVNAFGGTESALIKQQKRVETKQLRFEELKGVFRLYRERQKGGDN